MAVGETQESIELRVDFDSEEDVLYVSLGAPVPSHAEEAADGILLRRSNTEDRPTGVTAFDFRQNWRGRRNAFYELVARYLGIPKQVVERRIEQFT